MKKICILVLSCFSLAVSAQTLTPLAAAIFKNVKTKISITDKNAIAKLTGLSLAADKSYEMDGMPVYSVNVYPVDLNKDTKEEVFVVIGSSAVYGQSEQGFIIFMKNAGGSYVINTNETGTPLILKTAILGYPDILVGGPGFDLMPVLRWNGKTYVFNRKANAETTPSLGLEDVSAVYTKTIGP